MAFLKVSNLVKKFDSIIAVNNISFKVEKGEFLTLLGPSGCGKTTTLRCIAGLEKSEQGDIYVGEKLLQSAEKKVFVEPDKRGFGMVFQSYAIWPHLTVFDNISYLYGQLAFHQGWYSAPELPSMNATFPLEPQPFGVSTIGVSNSSLNHFVPLTVQSFSFDSYFGMFIMV